MTDKRGVRVKGVISMGYTVVLKRMPTLANAEYDHPTLAAAKKQAYALAHLHGLEGYSENIVLDHRHGVLVVDASDFYKRYDPRRQMNGSV